MFGAQGILAPLYQRQAQKFALAEEERRSQSQFEQMKALKQLEANLQMQIQAADPYRQAQTGAETARTEYYQAQLPGIKAESEREQGRLQAIRGYATAKDDKERAYWGRQIIAYSSGVQGLLEQPADVQKKAMVPILDEQGLPTGGFEWKEDYQSPPAGYLTGAQGVSTARLSLSDRMLRGIRDKYNPKSDRDVRRNYSGINWDAPAMKSLGVERAGILGVGAGQVGGGRMDWMDNIMQTMATPATAIDSTGMVVPDENEFNRRATIIENFKTALQDEPEGASKEKMRTILRDMQRAMNEAMKLSSEEGQLYLSNPQAQPQQPTEEEWSPLNTWTP